MNNMIYNIRQPPVYPTQQQSLGNGGGGGGIDQTIASAMKQNNGHLMAEKLTIGLDHVPPSFNLREQLTGVAGANLQYIRKETGVNITLRGIGSLFIEPNTGTESQEPLHFFIEHQRLENLNSAKQLAKNLIETLQQEFLQFQQQSPALPQINIPPPSMVNVPPPSIIQSNVAPTANASAPANIIHQQFVTQGGIPMHLQQGNMVIQQPPHHAAGGHNLSMPPPMKQIVQFHQPPPQIQATVPSLQATQATSPIILNHQPQASIQYQYIQQPSRDVQGNQLTLQQVYHQQPQQIQGIHMQALPPPNQLQQQQQYITVQGNTAYMVPPPTIIQQAQGQPTQLSIIQHPPPLHMQLPSGSIAVQAPIAEGMQQQLEQSQLRTEQPSSAENEDYSIEKQEEIEQPSTAEEDSIIAPVGESETSLVRSLTTSVPPPMRQPPPMTHIPPPTITMSVPPPINGVQQHIVGNTLYTTTTTNQVGSIQQFQQQVIPLQAQHQQTQQYIHTAPNGQNYVMNTATAQWQARAQQPTQFVTQQISPGDIHTLPPPAVSMSSIPVSGASVQQTTPMAVTFSQPMMQQQLQLQFQPQMMQQVQMQAQPATQQFNIIQTHAPPPQAMLQQHHHHQQQQQMGVISVNQNGLPYSQAASNAPPSFLQQQQHLQQQHLQQQQLQQQQRPPPPPPPPTYGAQMMIKSGQKRKSTSDPTDAPPPIQAKLGVGWPTIRWSNFPQRIRYRMVSLGLFTFVAFANFVYSFSHSRS
ncbi:putative mediator of RNA polymerase II transcription subunit 12 isoform X3 [Episyrphus balteatus]|uniref:putative mediator of RNA polymerase II transcription subunit 12 isoform X3 n=1 Tax=Episyrphus balteatus TaxID=286459 RepID=UPI00248550DC|nr:putative mediator of RNA polymerase II transcription subunit 12 isoform X3 [Episyrphus balteatus]